MGYISMNNVSYSYPTSEGMVIKNIDLSLEKGKFYALVGRNGSGKTTICNIIRGFIPHFYKGDLTGDVIVNDKNIKDEDLGSLALEIGYVFQNPFNQISGIKETVFEELAYGLENFGVKREEMIERVNGIIDIVNLADLKDKNPMELSGGQQQRVALASILIMDPEIIVIDEPTSQLDPQATESVFKIIEFMKNKGKTIILVEHKMDLIAEFADEIIIIDEGEVKLHDVTEKVLTDSRLMDWGVSYTEYTKLAMALLKKQFQIETIPTKIDEAAEMVENIVKRGETDVVSRVERSYV